MKSGLQIARRVRHDGGMAKNPKRPRDPNQLAKLITEIATGEVEDDDGAPISTHAERGRLGGLKGGKARAKALTADQRAASARRAAAARWAR